MIHTQIDDDDDDDDDVDVDNAAASLLRVLWIKN